ncbi:MAG: ATP phosphoribosyltransferase regulatory subunit, partial [Phycisphaerales bacterium]
DIVVRISHRDVVVQMLQRCGVPKDKMQIALTLLDKREKMAPEVFLAKLQENDLEAACFAQFDGDIVIDHEELTSLQNELNAWGIQDWCVFDFTIVRGLAYYTGIVFEIHERSGSERAIAGGGRYDKLIEMFGGPSMPAVGFGMGDVVLSLVLKDKELLGDGSEFLPKPDVFVISAGGEADAHLASTVASLRNAGLHARMTYRATRNVGKLLTEAAKTSTRFTIILGEELTHGNVIVKDMDSGEQTEVALSDIVSHITT